MRGIVLVVVLFALLFLSVGCPYSRAVDAVSYEVATPEHPSQAYAYQVMLPLMMRDYDLTPAPTPTATPTPTRTATPKPTSTPLPTATPRPCATKGVQSVVDSSFELNSGAWVWAGYAVRSSKQSHDGSYSAFVGGYRNSTDGVGQTIIVPSWAISATVDLWYLQLSNAPLAGLYEDLIMTILDMTTLETLVRADMWYYPNFRGQWLQRQVTVTGLERRNGRTLILGVDGHTGNIDNPTRWYVDQVRLVFYCSQ